MAKVREAPPAMSLAEIVKELHSVQRERVIVLKTRIILDNRIQAVVATNLGYAAKMDEKERKRFFTEAAAKVKAIEEANPLDCVGFDRIIKTHVDVADRFDSLLGDLEKNLVRYARMLPVRPWVEHPDQNGFGILSLGVVVGEAGDLSKYANPAKLWKRMGCAPHSWESTTLMGSTWRGHKPSLPAVEWEAYGYSPRRRSISYLFGENIVRQNGEGPYRTRYEEAKARVKEKHPEYSAQRCHRHGMLLATKLLLKNLWVVWNGYPAMKSLHPNASMPALAVPRP